MKINKFDADFSFGIFGQKLFVKENIIGKVIKDFSGEELVPIKSMNGQKSKGDFMATNIHGKKIPIEIKTRRPDSSGYHMKDVIIEFSNTPQPCKGKEIFDAWKYSEDTILVYQWTEGGIGEVFLLRPVICFKPYDLNQHKEWLLKYPIKSAFNPGKYGKQPYYTNFFTVPIEDLKNKIKVKII